MRNGVNILILHMTRDEQLSSFFLKLFICYTLERNISMTHLILIVNFLSLARGKETVQFGGLFSVEGMQEGVMKE